MELIRVGLIGANPDRGWSASAHLPALAALEGFDLRAVCTTRIDSAKAAALRFGAKHAFADAAALVALPDIDLVVVAVRAPKHAENVRMAIEAGKNVFCEWPLGTSTAQSTALLSLAQAQGIRHFVGLQGHASPAAIHARELIARGYLGETLSVTMRGVHAAWGAVTPAGLDYLLDAENGVTIASIAGGHAIDMMCSLVGEIASVSGIVANRRPFVIAGDGKTKVAKTAPDQFLFTGELVSGVPVSVHMQGGVLEHDCFTLDIHGTEGTLRVKTGFMPEILPTELFGTRTSGGSLEPIAIPATCRTAPVQLSGPPVNVAQLYGEIAIELGGATSPQAPDFARAIRCRTIIDTVARSAEIRRHMV